MADRMSEEEMQALTEKINTYWQNRPKAEKSEEKKKLIPVHDFDNLDFTSDEHVNAVRERYMKDSIFAQNKDSDAQ